MVAAQRIVVKCAVWVVVVELWGVVWGKGGCSFLLPGVFRFEVGGVGGCHGFVREDEADPVICDRDVD